MKMMQKLVFRTREDVLGRERVAQYTNFHN